MQIIYGRFPLRQWHLHLLPSIEFKNYHMAGLSGIFRYKYALKFRYLYFWMDVQLWKVGDK